VPAAFADATRDDYCSSIRFVPPDDGIPAAYAKH